jgi:hypothetical protein
MKSGMPIETVQPRERDVETADAPSPSSNDARREEAKPEQDEWGLFDPEQCGVAALLKKLKILR